MFRSQIFRAGAIGISLSLGSAATFCWSTPALAAAQESLRAEVGKPLQAAQELIKTQKYKEALAEVAKTDSIANKTPYERFIIERMRGAAATGAGDADTAAKAFEAVIDSGRLPADEQSKLMEALAGTFYRSKDYAKAINWASRYQKAGGTDPSVQTLLLQSYYLSGDYAAASKEVQAQVGADEKAGRTPTEQQLQLLASCYLKQNDNAGYSKALEKLVTYHPTKEYWADLLAHIQRKPGFSERLSLDVYRLKQATGNLKQTGDYMEMAQLALQAGFPLEGKKIVDQGFAAGLLGSGPEADRHKRLRDLATRQSADDAKNLDQDAKQAMAKDGTAMVSTGYNEVLNGRADSGIKLIESGIAKGSLRHPEDAKLWLGEAYLLAGQKAKAVQALRSVQGTDGTADLARLWMIKANQGT